MPRTKNSSFNACLTKVSSFNRVRFIRNDCFFFLKQTGTVLKVEVQVRFPTIGLSRNTPVMQAVVFEDPSDSRFLSVWPVSQVKKNLRRHSNSLHHPSQITQFCLIQLRLRGHWLVFGDC